MENYLFYSGIEVPTIENLDNWVDYNNPRFQFWIDKGYDLVLIATSNTQFYDGIVVAFNRNSNLRLRSQKWPIGYYKQISNDK